MCIPALVFCFLALLASSALAQEEPQLSTQMEVHEQSVNYDGLAAAKRTVITSDVKMAYDSGLYVREESSFGAEGSDAFELGSGFEGECFAGFSCNADIGYRFLPRARVGTAALKAGLKRVFNVLKGAATISAQLEETMPENAASERRVNVDTNYAHSFGRTLVGLTFGLKYDRLAGGMVLPAGLSAKFSFPEVPRLSLSADAGVTVPYAVRMPERTSMQIGLHLHYAW